MHQKSNQKILLEKYVQELKVVYKEHMYITILLCIIIFTIGFTIIYSIYDPSISFFIDSIIGIGIIMSLKSFKLWNNVKAINKAKKLMHAYNLDEFKQSFKIAYRQQFIQDAKIYFPIFIGIVGILTYMHFIYYPEDTWFRYVLILTLATIPSIFKELLDSKNLFVHIKDIEKKTNVKINESNSFIKTHQGNNQTVLLEKYLQAFRNKYKEHAQFSLLVPFLIFGIAFAIIHILFNPSTMFFIYVISGIGIILCLHCFKLWNNIKIIDKAKKTIHEYNNLNEFKQSFRKTIKLHHLKNIKIYLTIYMGIVGLLIFIHLAYYPEDIWFIYILLTIGFFAFFGIAGLYLDFFNIGSEAKKKINESDSFIN